jgi:hypothetical protein
MHAHAVTVRGVKPIATAQLGALTTERLLAYRDRLLALGQSIGSSDLDAIEKALLDPSVLISGKLGAVALAWVAAGVWWAFDCRDHGDVGGGRCATWMVTADFFNV